MADFTILTSGRSLPGATSFNTASITPTVGTLVFVGFVSQNGSGAAISGAGMTWTRIGNILTGIDGDSAATVFYAASGTPSAGALTISATGSIYAQHHAVIRPDDLGALNTTLVNTPSVANTPRTVTLSSAADCGGVVVMVSSPWSYGDNGPFAVDGSGGWVEKLDLGAPANDAGSLQVQTVLADQADIAIAATTEGNRSCGVFAVEYAAAAAAASSGAGVNRGLVNGGTNAGINAGLIRRSMSKLNEWVERKSGLLVPKDSRLIVPVGIQVQGA